MVIDWTDPPCLTRNTSSLLGQSSLDTESTIFICPFYLVSWTSTVAYCNALSRRRLHCKENPSGPNLNLMHGGHPNVIVFVWRYAWVKCLGALLKSVTTSAKIMNVVTKGYVCINNENHNNVLSSILFNNALSKEYEIKRNNIGTK